MLRSLLSACLALALPFPAPAQDTDPLFRSTTQLVEFTFVALDKNGKPVTDLRKEELTLDDKGKPRDLAFLRFEGAPAAATTAAAASPPPGRFSNRVDFSGGPPRNLTAIVIDTLNTDPKDAVWVRAETLRFLRAIAPDTRVAVYLLGRQVAVIHDFTDDMASLRRKLSQATLALPPLTELNMNTVIAEAEALLRMSEGNPILEQMLRDQIESDQLANEALRRRRLDMTLVMLESLGRHLGGIPGRKNLVWIGGGISMLSITGAMGFGAKGGVTSFESQVMGSARRLAQQGVTLYNVDARGLQTVSAFDSANSTMVTPGRRRAFGAQQQAETISADPLPAMMSMAAATGGRVIQNTNDPMDAVRLAATDLQGAYSTGFYLPDEPDGKWRSVKLRTSRPGVRLTYREGYFAQPASSQPLSWSKDEWVAAFLNPLGASSIHLDALCGPAVGEAPGAMLVRVEMDPAELHFRPDAGKLAASLEVGLGEINSTGLAGYQKMAGNIRLPLDTQKLPPPSENRIEKLWKPADGVLALRIIVRDAHTGRFGTLDIPLRACTASE